MKWSEDDSFLFIGAHPDDAEIKAGGLISMLVRDGIPVHVLLTTYGFSCYFGDESWEVRAKEQEDAVFILGCTYSYWTYADCDTLQPTLANRKYLTGEIRKHNPTVIITHRIFDYHPDHRATGQLVIDALPLLHKHRYVTPGVAPIPRPQLYFFYDQMRPTFTVDAFVDIGDVMKVKRDAINAHTTQRTEYSEFYPDEEAQRMSNIGRYSPYQNGIKDEKTSLFAEIYERYQY